MAIKRVVTEAQTTLHVEKKKLKARFGSVYMTANTVAELKKCIGLLAKYVFDEKEGKDEKDEKEEKGKIV